MKGVDEWTCPKCGRIVKESLTCPQCGYEIKYGSKWTKIIGILISLAIIAFVVWKLLAYFR
ncbi:MAG: hypothetical protein ACE5J5_01400 [Candidatus Hydrothermarchaeales archaeon]